jgi:hypothetical protein
VVEHSAHYPKLDGSNPATGTSGLYYKPITIVNDNSRVDNKLETSHTDDARFVIYDHHMFVVQATGERK